MAAAIEVRNLHKRFGHLHAVNDISLDVAKGDVLGFLGPNGAGKSTTMKMITGFLQPTSGSIRVAGYDVLNNPLAAKARIGYLPEGAPTYGEMTPLGFLEFIADVRGLRGAMRLQRIEEVISKIHLESVLQQRIETLSKGFKRRVGLAQAILHDPEILIMDEPTDGLDPNQKFEVRSLITAMAKDKAIIISTHILEEVEALCTQTAIIATGRLLFTGTPAELVARSKYHNAVVIQLSSEHVDEARRALEALPEVQEVEIQTVGNTETRLTVLPNNGATLLSAVDDLTKQHAWPVSELHVDGGRLDEVFRTITTANQEPGSALS
jgi:ABC-2 type transport system ATP-binding protein